MIVWALGTLFLTSVAWVDASSLELEVKQDVILQALIDELERGKEGLRLGDLEPPYFIEFELLDGMAASVSAELGAVTAKDVRKSRFLRTDVRVGSYELDNSNFQGPSGPPGGGIAVPIEDDYTAIRQALWWSMDRQYKSAVEQLAEKRAFMAGKLIEDKPSDFSRQEPQRYLDARCDLKGDAEQAMGYALPLSGVFRNFADIKESSVNVTAATANKYIINTEGTRIRTAHRRYSITVSATAQAADGMELGSGFQSDGRTFEQLPSVEELVADCRQLAEQLGALSRAPILEAYTGPVLVEPEAFASLFQRFYAGRFAGGQRPVGSRTHPDDFGNKLNKRILPRGVRVVDDPTLETLNGKVVMGQFRFDDQGIKARPVTLVENGRLQALLMSRNPSKDFSSSTGHGRGLFGPRAAPGCMVFSAMDGVDAKALRQELIEAAQDEGLPYGIRIAALAGGTGGRDLAGAVIPLLTYKVYPDGREELVRGVEFARIDLKSFKRILAVGKEPYILNSHGAFSMTIATPAVLFEELDLAKMDRDFDRPPILPSAVARAQKQ